LRKIIINSGTKFGKLTVIEYGHKLTLNRKGYLCKCDCGNEKVVRSTDLINGKIKSCGCGQASPRKNLLNKKFGRLTIIECLNEKRGKNYLYKCKCECGNIITVIGSNIIHGKTKSCGCLNKEIHSNLRIRFIDLTNQKFGKLTVLYELPSNKIRTKWMCQCECGNKIAVFSNYLQSGDTTSCGCLKINKLQQKSKYYKLSYEEAKIKKIKSYHEKSAKLRNIDFKLTENEIHSMVFQNCYYCGDPPNRKFKISGHNKTIKINRIDRLNNNIGYINNNCVPCCSICNILKGRRSHDEFIKTITKIAKYQKEKSNKE
jgi:hypothetical protein